MFPLLRKASGQAAGKGSGDLTSAAAKLSLAAVCVLMIAAVAAMWQSQRLTYKREQMRLAAFAERAADLTLAWQQDVMPLLALLGDRLIRDQNADFLNNQDVEDRIAQFGPLVPQILAVEAYDPSGSRIWSQCIRAPCQPEPAAMVPSPIEWLAQANEDSQLARRLSEPFSWSSRPARVGAFALVSEPIGDRGRFLFTAIVDLEDLEKRLGEIMQGNASGLTVATVSRQFIARIPPMSDEVRRRIEATGTHGATAVVQSRSVSQDISLIDGQRRLSAWQPVEGSPIYVVASVSTAEADAIWLNYARVILWSFFGLALMLTPLAILSFIAARRASARTAELTESTERLAEAEEIAGIGHGVFDPVRQEIFWSSNMYRLFGLVPGSTRITFDLLMSFIHPDDRAAYSAYAKRRSTRPSSTDTTQFRIIRQNDLAVRYFREKAHAKIDAHGRIVRMSGILIDETDTVEKDTALRLSAQRLREAEETVGLGWWLVERFPTRVVWSAQCFRILGLSERPGEIEPSIKLFLDMVHPDDRETVRLSRQKLLEDGERQEILFRLQRADGAMRYLLDRSVGERGPSGEIMQLHGTLLDITETIETHEALDFSRTQEQMVLRAANLGAWFFDPEQTVFTFDDACRAVLAIADDAKPMRAADLMSIVAMDDRAAMQKAIVAMRSAGQDTTPAGDADTANRSGRIEIRIRRPDSVVRIVQLAWIVDQSPYSKRKRVCGTLQDITDQRFAQLASSRQQRIDTAELLAGGIAHDFNNILGIMLGNLEFALDPNINRSEMRERVELAMRAGNRAADLTRKLRRVAGASAEEHEPCHPSKVLEDMRALILSGVTPVIEVQLSAEAKGLVRMTAADLGDAIINLTANAAAAMPNGGTLFIGTRDVFRAEPQSTAFGMIPAGDCVEIVVRDSGTGIESEVIDRIFEPFFTTKDASKGSGLGLAIVQSAVYRAGGIILLQSEINRGSEFTIVLPTIG